MHKLDCWQHLRNIFLKEMSAAQAKHVNEELKAHLEAFSSWERMTTEYSQLLRAAYKEFHHGNAYYKGKGREFAVWLKEHHPKAFAVHFERAEGGRKLRPEGAVGEVLVSAAEDDASGSSPSSSPRPSCAPRS